MTMKAQIYLQRFWVASAGRCELFYVDGARGSFDESGDFRTADGRWIAYKSDNATHPAFN